MTWRKQPFAGGPLSTVTANDVKAALMAAGKLEREAIRLMHDLKSQSRNHPLPPVIRVAGGEEFSWRDGRRRARA